MGEGFGDERDRGEGAGLAWGLEGLGEGGLEGLGEGLDRGDSTGDIGFGEGEGFGEGFGDVTGDSLGDGFGRVTGEGLGDGLGDDPWVGGRCEGLAWVVFMTIMETLSDGTEVERTPAAVTGRSGRRVMVVAVADDRLKTWADEASVRLDTVIVIDVDPESTLFTWPGKSGG